MSLTAADIEPDDQGHTAQYCPCCGSINIMRPEGPLVARYPGRCARCAKLVVWAGPLWGIESRLVHLA